MVINISLLFLLGFMVTNTKLLDCLDIDFMQTSANIDTVKKSNHYQVCVTLVCIRQRCVTVQLNHSGSCSVIPSKQTDIIIVKMSK